MAPNPKLTKKSGNRETLAEETTVSGDGRDRPDQDALALAPIHGSEQPLALTPIPAAQYLRMSRVQQRLSIESQAQAIEWYVTTISGLSKPNESGGVV
jgi:hypothetical protein